MKRIETIKENIQKWYRENKRDLPWRKTKEPYLIWISEIMAQQTRIETMKNYYERFVSAYPTIKDLAIADEESVLKLWEGLGYYSRARNLHACAKIIHTKYQGVFPQSKEEIRALPGIGDYTTGAIMSIAFEKPYPAVDGNVLRVFSRLEASEENILSLGAKRNAESFVEKLMHESNPRDLTQGLMELGALICIPTKPKCSECPVSQSCIAHEKSMETLLPIKIAKNKRREEEKVVLILISNHKNILVRKRTENLLHHLWEYYLHDFITETNIEEHLTDMGLELSSCASIGKSKHIFTHITWFMTGYVCILNNEIEVSGYDWMSFNEVMSLAKPTAIKYYSDWLLLNENKL